MSASRSVFLLARSTARIGALAVMVFLPVQIMIPVHAGSESPKEAISRADEEPESVESPELDPIDGDETDDTILVPAGGELTSTSGGTAHAVDGRGGNDVITNQGTIDVLAKGEEPSSLDPSESSLTTSLFEATATGIAGGAGDDTVRNQGLMWVEAQSILHSLSAFESAMTEASATGIAGRDGADALSSTVGLDVQAGAEASTLNVSFQGFGSFPTSAHATATGIAGGEGSDGITISGNGAADGTSLSVQAVSSATSHEFIAELAALGLASAPITRERS